MTAPTRGNDTQDQRDTHGMSITRRDTAIAAGAAVLVAAIAAVLMLALGSDDDSGSRASQSPATTTPSLSPSDRYIAELEASGHFKSSITGRLRELRIITGRDACDILRANNGDVVDARFKVSRELVDFGPSGEGYAEEGLAEKSVALVAAASRHLCPGVAAA